MIGDERAQTNQDFAVGISIFLLTTAFVFAFIPTIFAPFDENAQNSEVAQSNRVASAFVDTHSVNGKPATLDSSRVEVFFDAGTGGDALRTLYSLPTTSQVNMTVRTQNGSVIHELDTTGDGNGDLLLARGDTYRDQPSSSTSRIVTFDEGNVCNPESGNDKSACRLLVRVW